MDYRNADGSVAEMCGNGVRVYARYLADAGWLPDGAARCGWAPGPGCARSGSTGGEVVRSTWARRASGRRRRPRVDGRAFPGIAVDVGNPHLACVTDVPLDALDLTAQPGHDPRAVPARGERRVRLPAAATAGATVRDAGARARRGGDPLVRHRHRRRRRRRAARTPAGTPATSTVRTPGGRLRVTVDAGTTVLHGPGGAGRLRRARPALVGVALTSRPERPAASTGRSGGSMPTPTMTELPQRPATYGTDPTTGLPRPAAPPPASSTSRSAARCAASPACPPSSPTSPRSSTGSCAWSGSCSSVSGPRAPPSRPGRR